MSEVCTIDKTVLMCACLGEEYPLMFIGQILYIWIAITEYVQSAFSSPDTCTQLLNFFILTKRILDWHHFCK